MLKQDILLIRFTFNQLGKNNLRNFKFFIYYFTRNIFAKIVITVFFHPFKKQNFVGNSALNDLLNETASGDTNTESALASVNDPFSTSGVLPTENMPTGIANVVNRDYRSLMKAIDKKKGR